MVFDRSRFVAQQRGSRQFLEGRPVPCREGLTQTIEGRLQIGRVQRFAAGGHEFVVLMHRVGRCGHSGNIV